jgi:hypothetical protein
MFTSNMEVSSKFDLQHHAIQGTKDMFAIVQSFGNQNHQSSLQDRSVLIWRKIHLLSKSFSRGSQIIYLWTIISYIDSPNLKEGSGCSGTWRYTIALGSCELRAMLVKRRQKDVFSQEPYALRVAKRIQVAQSLFADQDCHEWISPHTPSRKHFGKPNASM